VTEGTALLGEIARTALDAAVPGFADSAVVFVLENLLRDGTPAASGRGRDSSGDLTARRILTRFPGRGRERGLFPLGEAVALSVGSPYAQCVCDGKPVPFTWPDAQTLDQAGPGGRAVFSRYDSFLAVPMNSPGGAAAGLIALARAAGRPPFGDSDIDRIMRLAALAGTGIASTISLDRHQSVSGSLQRGLLAGEPPRPDRLDVAGQCLPAHGHLVGGDWYDLIPLQGQRTGIIIGDVLGHGPGAAAVMAQLRAAARALAQLDPQPADLLRRMDRLTATLPGMQMATCVYAVIDPGWQSATLSTAGHLPPVLALPGRNARPLDIPGGQSLGIGPADYGQAYAKLPPGAILALYTDGLVETRTRSYDQGITTLQDELSRADGPLDATCDTIINALARHPEDDATLILARIPRPGP
jgi:hypothetical protein